MLRSVAPMTGREVKNDDARLWHLADNPIAAANVRYWSNNGQRWILARDGLSAFDPKRTSSRRDRNMLSSLPCSGFRSGPFSEIANQPASIYGAVILIWRFANNRCLC